MTTKLTETATGWVMRDETTLTKTGRVHVSYWYGPNHGWGRTFGGLDYSVAVFPTRKAAEQAWRGEFGTLRAKTTAQRLEDARLEKDGR